MITHHGGMSAYSRSVRISPGRDSRPGKLVTADGQAYAVRTLVGQKRNHCLGEIRTTRCPTFSPTCRHGNKRKYLAAADKLPPVNCLHHMRHGRKHRWIHFVNSCPNFPSFGQVTTGTDENGGAPRAGVTAQLLRSSFPRLLLLGLALLAQGFVYRMKKPCR